MKAFVITALCVISIAFNSQAQDKTKLIGNKLRSGSSISSYAVNKGEQVAIKMDAGKKPVKLLTLNFDLDTRSKDSLAFRVNIYDFTNDVAGENYVKQDIIGVAPHGKNKVSIDLAPYNIQVKGNILAAVEWVKTVPNANPFFSIGLFNGGTYTYTQGEWKKQAIFGADFNILVKKLD